MDSANEWFSGCARWHKAANMNGRAIPGAYLFRLYVCVTKKWADHITYGKHQPDWVYVRDSEKFRLTNVIPERIIFVSRGITVFLSSAWYPAHDSLEVQPCLSHYTEDAKAAGCGW